MRSWPGVKTSGLVPTAPASPHAGSLAAAVGRRAWRAPVGAELPCVGVSLAAMIRRRCSGANRTCRPSRRCGTSRTVTLSRSQLLGTLSTAAACSIVNSRSGVLTSAPTPGTPVGDALAPGNAGCVFSRTDDQPPDALPLMSTSTRCLRDPHSHRRLLGCRSGHQARVNFPCPGLPRVAPRCAARGGPWTGPRDPEEAAGRSRRRRPGPRRTAPTGTRRDRRARTVWDGPDKRTRGTRVARTYRHECA